MPEIRCCLAEGYLRLYYLLAANTKRIISGTMDVRKQGKAFLVIRPLVFSSTHLSGFRVYQDLSLTRLRPLANPVVEQPTDEVIPSG
jgi:hypothetical protein